MHINWFNLIIGILCLLSSIWMLFWTKKNTFKWGFWFMWSLMFGLANISWGLFEDVILK
jgi:hypothetical protein